MGVTLYAHLCVIVFYNDNFRCIMLNLFICITYALFCCFVKNIYFDLIENVTIKFCMVFFFYNENCSGYWIIAFYMQAC